MKHEARLRRMKRLPAANMKRSAGAEHDECPDFVVILNE